MKDAESSADDTLIEFLKKEQEKIHQKNTYKVDSP